MKDLKVVLYSPEQEYPEHTTLWLKAFGIEKIWKLPPWLVPGHKAQRSYRDPHTGAQVTYEEVIQRAYGFWYGAEDYFLQIQYGAQEESGDLYGQRLCKVWCCSLPWCEWNHFKSTLHNPDGSFFAETTNKNYEQEQPLLAALPKIYFQIRDFDGEVIQSVAHIKELTWTRGTGRWRWLRWFCKPLVKRSLDIRYTSEVGSRKRSWKGGTMGMAVDLRPGESNLDALTRLYSADSPHKRDQEIELVPDTYHISMKPELLIYIFQWVLGTEQKPLPSSSVRELVWRTNIKLLKEVLPKELRPLRSSKAKKEAWVMAFLNQDSEIRRGLLIKHPLLIYVLPSDLIILDLLEERPQSCGNKKVMMGALVEFPVYSVADTVCYWHAQQFRIKNTYEPQSAAY